MADDITIPDIPIFDWKTGTEKEKPKELSLFFVLFSIHEEKQWAAHAGYVFAYDRKTLETLLNKKYGSVVVRSATSVNIQEGTVLYGERWTAL